MWPCAHCTEQFDNYITLYRRSLDRRTVPTKEERHGAAKDKVQSQAQVVFCRSVRPQSLALIKVGRRSLSVGATQSGFNLGSSVNHKPRTCYPLHKAHLIRLCLETVGPSCIKFEGVLVAGHVAENTRDNSDGQSRHGSFASKGELCLEDLSGY